MQEQMQEQTCKKNYNNNYINCSYSIDGSFNCGRSVSNCLIEPFVDAVSMLTQLKNIKHQNSSIQNKALKSIYQISS